MRLNYEAAIAAIAAKVGIDLAQFSDDYDAQKAAIVIDPAKVEAEEKQPAIPFEPSGVIATS